MKRWRTRWIIPGAILVLFSSVALFVATGGVKVMIHNKTGGSLAEVSCSYTGGRKTAGPIEPGATAKVRVRPSGESNVVLDYVDASGVHHRQPVDVYIEPGYRGTLDVDVLPTGSVVRSENFRLF